MVCKSKTWETISVNRCYIRVYDDESQSSPNVFEEEKKKKRYQPNIRRAGENRFTMIPFTEIYNFFFLTNVNMKYLLGLKLERSGAILFSVERGLFVFHTPYTRFQKTVISQITYCMIMLRTYKQINHSMRNVLL